METEDTIHEFWFGNGGSANQIAGRQSSLWWGKQAEHDQAIRERFEPLLLQVRNGALDRWAESHRGLLALVIVSDQFPRTIYRGDRMAFAFDDLARKWCRKGIDRGLPEMLEPIEKVFLYLPLEHSESLADQELCVSLYAGLAHSVAPNEKELFQGYLDFARKHHAIVARFGRFPHRNAALERRSTPEELAFLKETGSSF